ncbi:MAG: hypothetical protein ACO1O1_04325 [Adhaeribacter sp.]
MNRKETRQALGIPGNSAPGPGVVLAPKPAGRFSGRRLWGQWVLAASIALGIQLLTLDVLPHLQQDEAQITDYGRLALDPHSDWSVTWWTAEGKPLVLWSYLGPVMAEVSYQLGGASGLGPRLASLIGGFWAATMALGWLLARRVPPYAAFGLSLALLLDPLFVLSQRMARVDSWVIALCLACCWLLRATPVSKDHAYDKWRLMAAGGLAATAAFVWPSAVFLYPLVLLELFYAARADKEGAGRKRFSASRVFYFGAGGLLGGALLLLPIWQILPGILEDMTKLVAQNVDPSKSDQDRLLALFNYQNWLALMRTFRRAFSPVFPLLALAGALLYREKGLILAFILTLSVLFASLLYFLRVLYLLPYLLALGSGVFIYAAASSGSLQTKRWSRVTLGLLLTWSVSISLLIRTALGLEGKTERDRDHIYQAAMSRIGAGQHHVFLAYTYEFYFAGRALGWKLYTPYIQYSTKDRGIWDRPYKPTPQFRALLSRMDYVLIAKGGRTEKLDEQLARSNPELEKQLARSGLQFSARFRVGEDDSPNRTKDFLLWLFQGRGLAFLQGKEYYGSYVLYTREKQEKKHPISLSAKEKMLP